MSIPRLNPYRSTITPPGVVARPNRDRHSAREDAAALTERDRELIFQATGQRIAPGEPNQGWINSLAAAIAADRTAGRLAPGQEINEVYLRDLARRYDQNPTGRNPIAGYLDAALRHLDQHGPRTIGRLDVSA
ncbi:hypothetical protein [Actinoplanes utahensis]|uniref:Uncharacterized protein n=1 Tax=Actinoplanes utahensis TaxID=1869 RepID=A0A0A6UQR3_ACTUT|nr:hypothetical protein [Actinoplanes utahensis]KHD76724.1 hypothetical protein MB27_15680 [Actinoplanes utahensis]GIF33214.1 hypothetical protein Aut01nite_62000 [Actinoplanes utahensis]